MLHPLKVALMAGTALLVAACGGGAANNIANTPAGNDTNASSEPTMAPIVNMSAGMPDENNTMAAPAPAGNTAAPAGNTANGM